jgi:hypothetical protein
MQLIRRIRRAIPVGPEILDCHQTAINSPKTKQLQANGLSSQKRPSH